MRKLRHSIEFVVASVTSRRRISGFLVGEMAKSRKPSHNVCSSILIADTGVGAMGDWAPKAVPRKPRALPLGSVVLAFQADHQMCTTTIISNNTRWIRVREPLLAE